MGRTPKRATRGTTLLACAALLAGATPAHAQDPAAARELLKRGYELKQANNCKDAIPIFEESVRLDPQPKSVLNLADCEEQVGALGNSQKHWLLARDIGKREGNTAIVQESEGHLLAIDKRFARLTIRLPVGAPPSAIVLRDGVELGQASLGLALPIDPGVHVLLLRTRGYRESRKEVTLRESESQEVRLELGPLDNTPPPQTTPQPSNPPQGVMVAPPSEGPHSGLSGLKVGAIALGAGGVVVLASGVVVGVLGKGKYNDASGNCGLNGISNLCTQAGYEARNDARTMGTAGTVLFLVGAAMVGGGVALFLLDDSKSGARARATPLVTRDAAGASITGTF